MTAKCTINGHAFQYLNDALSSNAFDKLKVIHQGKFHPWSWSADKFPGLKELDDQDPRPEGVGFDNPDIILNLEFTDEAISDIQAVLLEEIEKSRQGLQECEDDPQPLKILNIPEALNSQIEELLYFARCFQCDLRPEDEALAQEVMNRRAQGNGRGRSDVITTVPLIPKAARESFKTLVFQHLQTLPQDRWEDLRAFAARSNNGNDIPEPFEPDLTPERLVEECVLEVSGPLMSDYLQGPYETTAHKLGDVEGKPVYYIDAGGFYVYEHPRGYCLQIDITFPAAPPHW